MTIKDVINFYFSKYDELVINVEMLAGMRGKAKTFTKKEALVHLNNWLDEEVLSVGFHTASYIHGDPEVYEFEIPHLNILYK